jgi:hypothetical protein
MERLGLRWNYYFQEARRELCFTDHAESVRVGYVI